jgi:hypothetical protein
MQGAFATSDAKNSTPLIRPVGSRMEALYRTHQCAVVPAMDEMNRTALVQCGFRNAKRRTCIILARIFFMTTLLRWLVIGVVPLMAAAQQRSPSAHLDVPVIGTVKGVSGETISVDSDGKVVSITVDRNAEIWKGKVFHDLSPAQIGDDLSARCRSGGKGKLVCEAIWLNIVNFFGVITRVHNNDFEVLMNPDADPQSAYVKKTKIVQVDSGTLFNDSAKEDLRPGRNVQVIGLDLKNGMIRATRVTVYEGKRPVRMKSGTILAPDGKTIRQH